MNYLNKLAKKYGTDKQSNEPGQNIYHNYTPFYHSIFNRDRFNFKNILEIGVRTGASHKMWYDYFVNANIYGVDNCSEISWEEMQKNENDRIKIFVGSQDDKKFLEKSFDGIVFDAIIDDGGHGSWQQQISFATLFPQLKSGGYYIIEDISVSVQYRQFEDMRSCSINWLQSIQENKPFSYYMNADEFQPQIDACFFVGELGVIYKK
jgi:hypothetical protein